MCRHARLESRLESIFPVVALIAVGAAVCSSAPLDPTRAFASRPLDAFPLNAIKASRARVGPTAWAPLADSAKSTNGAGTALYLYNNSHVVPGKTALLKFDVDTKNVTTVATTDYAQNDCYSAAVQCGDHYYAVWDTFPAAAGIVSIDLKTGDANFLGTGGQNYLYHSLHCGQNASSLLGIASSPGTKHATFFLNSVSTTTGDSTVIAQFPTVDYAGYDGGFSFTEDGTQVYAAFPGAVAPRHARGDLYILNTATGAILEHHKIPYDKGIPYQMFPSGSDSFQGSFIDSATNKVELCSISKSGSAGGKVFPGSVLKLSDCSVKPELYVGSAPMPICNGKLYAVPDNLGAGPGSTQPLREIDLASGSVREIVDLASVIPGTYIGAVACAH
jgi:hypothetical protein